MRTTTEALIDRILLLYAVDRGNTYGCMDGPFKLMKIPLMAELDSTGEGVNTFSYRFYRFNHGPMTTEIYEDVEQLRKAGLLEVPERAHGYIKLTESGMNLLAAMAELYAQNEQVCKFVDDSARKYAGLSFGALKTVVYDRDVEIDGQKMKIADVPYFCDIISKLSGDVAGFQLDDDWIDTLWGDLNYTAEQKEKAHRIHAVPA